MRYTAFILFFLASYTAFSQRAISINGTITKLTVFREGAQVQRSASVAISGKKEIVLTGLSSSLDSQTIQVKAPESVRILSVHLRRNYLHANEKEETISRLEINSDSLDRSLQQDSSMLLILHEQLEMLRKNQSLDHSDAGNVTKLATALDFQRNKMKELYSDIADYQRKIRKKLKEQVDIGLQLEELAAGNDQPISEIVVLLQSAAAQQAKIDYSYMVSAAGWYPEYDVRVKSIEEPLQLQMKAQVFQESGEKWENIKLFLSTGNLSDNADKPFIKPWYLNYSQPAAFSQAVRIDNQLPSRPDAISGRIVSNTGAAIPNASVVIKGTNQRTATDASGYFVLPVSGYQATLQVSAIGYQTSELMANRAARLRILLNQQESLLQEVVVVGYGSSGSGNDSWTPTKNEAKTDLPVDTRVSYAPTTVEYEIQEPFSLPGDGKSYGTDIASFAVAANYQYYAAPRLEEAAYLQANITGWEEYNLLSGSANLYLEGSYLGTSYLDLLNQTDTLRISLGQDKNVIVQRKLLKETTDRRFLGTTKLEQRSYDILVRNRKQQAINIDIQEQFPIALHKEIEVKNKKYPDAEIDENSQIVSWKKSIAPQQNESLKFSFEVRYPARYWLNVDQPL